MPSLTGEGAPDAAFGSVSERDGAEKPAAAMAAERTKLRREILGFICVPRTSLNADPSTAIGARCAPNVAQDDKPDSPRIDLARNQAQKAASLHRRLPAFLVFARP